MAHMMNPISQIPGMSPTLPALGRDPGPGQSHPFKARKEIFKNRRYMTFRVIEHRLTNNQAIQLPGISIKDKEADLLGNTDKTMMILISRLLYRIEVITSIKMNDRPQGRNPGILT